uniref:Uncharacterized protein n=1 Tax=Ananas comosus var. bracteatus TaxID=296719 RepID=A0A6V7Q5V1_ANACO|nr:unnamed protein product [Ananas comosus var. bracteatus]
MGCYPIGKMVSKVLGKCNGRDNNNNNNNNKRRSSSRLVHTRVYSPPPTRSVSRSVTFSDNNPVYIIPPEPAAQPEPAVHRKPAQPEPAQPSSPEPEPVRRPGYGYRYVPSPLARWERTPRRQEYFSGEYNYYPTPVREGIYSIATDANRLTTIFSEENPNACSIA